MSSKTLSFLFLSCLFFSLNSHAAIDVYEFDTESQRERYNVLVDELRCPKCQNQNLAGSNSQIATDLRRELYRLLSEGKTDKEIKAFMVARYGDFVLYKPPFKSSTLVLWALPIVMLVLGLITLGLIIRQRRRADLRPAELSDDERAALKTLINDQSETPKT